MDAEAAREISSELGCVPIRVNAKHLSAAARNRLYWMDSEFAPQSGESVRPREWHVQVELAEDPGRLQ
eukprot:1508152-Alexandrium_andersonii.AAC.1